MPSECQKPRLKRAVKIHFNRIAMQRGQPGIWTVKTSDKCHPAEKVLIMRDGQVLLETVFNKDGQQPRAFFKGRAKVSSYGNTVVVEV